MRDRRWLKRAWLLLLTALLALSSRVVHADAPGLPHRAWLPGFGGSCDGGPLSCTRIDELAFHARADAMFASSTPHQQRGTSSSSAGMVVPANANEIPRPCTTSPAPALVITSVEPHCDFLAGLES